VKKASEGADSNVSPIGRTAEEASQTRRVRSATYRALQEKHEPFREVAWLLIKYRMDHGLTQQQLADKVGTSYSQISRIERGQHETSIRTLRRIAEALDVRLLIGFESKSDQGARRELVAV